MRKNAESVECELSMLCGFYTKIAMIKLGVLDVCFSSPMPQEKFSHFVE